MNACILVVDDDPEVGGAIAITLEREGYRVLRAYDGMEALDLALDPAVRLILIDVMMPKLDGLSALLRIREKRNLPVIVLSAKSEDTDKILGLSMGADDYVTKPFSPVELTVRVDALIRRSSGGTQELPPGTISQPPFLLNTRNRTLEKNGQRIKLTQVEYSIMKVFMENPGKALSREEILDMVWGRDYFGELKIVDVNIRRLRLKIEDNVQNPTYITTVWGYGYKWGF